MAFERYWDGAAWSGEHRFAAPADDGTAQDGYGALRVAIAEARLGDYVAAVPGGVWLVVGYAAPLLYLVCGERIATSLHDCTRQPEENWALGLGTAIGMAAAASCLRGCRMLALRWWAQALVVAGSMTLSAACVYVVVLVLIAFSSICC